MDWTIIRMRLAIGLLQSGVGSLVLSFLTLSCGGKTQVDAAACGTFAGIALIGIGFWLGERTMKGGGE